MLNNGVPSKIRATAHATRRWAKSLQRQYLIWSKDLECMCGIANFELFKRLKNQHFKVSFVTNSDHCFVEWNEFIVDIAATQFGSCYPAVTIVRRPQPNEFQWHRSRKKMTLLSNARRFFQPWPEDQCPFRWKKDYERQKKIRDKQCSILP